MRKERRKWMKEVGEGRWIKEGGVAVAMVIGLRLSLGSWVSPSRSSAALEGPASLGGCASVHTSVHRKQTEAQT